MLTSECRKDYIYHFGPNNSMTSVGARLENETGLQHMLLEARDFLNAALDLLDRAAAPAQIGAHVDLAIHQLECTLETAANSAQATPVGRAAAS